MILFCIFFFFLKEDLSHSDLESGGKTGPRVTQQPGRAGGAGGIDGSEMNSGSAIPLGNTGSSGEQQRLFNR